MVDTVDPGIASTNGDSYIPGKVGGPTRFDSGGIRGPLGVIRSRSTPEWYGDNGDSRDRPTRITRPHSAWSPEVVRMAMYSPRAGDSSNTYTVSSRTRNSGNCRPSNKNRRYAPAISECHLSGEACNKYLRRNPSLSRTDSSVGRTLPLQGRSHRFESCSVHSGGGSLVANSGRLKTSFRRDPSVRLRPSALRGELK